MRLRGNVDQGHMKEKKPLPILGIAHAAFQVSDLERARKHYTTVWGLECCFAVTEGRDALYFKINDDQFFKIIEVPGETDDNRFVEIAFQVSDIERTFSGLMENGLEPTPIAQRADGTLGCEALDPNEHRLLFVEYGLESQQARVRGKYLGPNRVSNRLQHVGLTMRDEAAANAFYRDALGFRETWRGARTDGGPDAWVNMQMPGERGDYVEYILINDDVPTRAQLGSMLHVCYLSDGIAHSHQKLLANGLPDLDRYKPMFGRSDRWLINVHDQDGTRSELMEA